LKNVGNQTVGGPYRFPQYFFVCILNGAHQLSGYERSSKYLLLCSAEERNSYR